MKIKITQQLTGQGSFGISNTVLVAYSDENIRRLGTVHTRTTKLIPSVRQKGYEHILLAQSREVFNTLHGFEFRKLFRFSNTHYGGFRFDTSRFQTILLGDLFLCGILNT